MPGLEAHAIIERLLSSLDEAMQGASGPATYFVDNRPDSGLLGSLAGLDAASASRVIAGTSIAAHVNHVVFAMDASACWIAGDKARRDWSASWRVTEVDKETWPPLLEQLRQEYGNLRVAIESGTVASDEAFGEAIGAIAHVAYHLGSVRQKMAILREVTATEAA